MQRRSFLKLCSSVGLGFAATVSVQQALASPRVKADNKPYDGPYYLVFNASGGWDTTYLMDPKGTGGVNRLYKEGDILTSGNLRYAPTAAHIDDGMSNEEFFTKYGQELLVLNGLDYSVNNHSPCSRYMATGELDSLAYPTFAALVAACRGTGQPLAFLTFGNYSATGNLVAMSRVPYARSLQKLANADGVNGSVRHSYHDDFVLERIERTLQEQYDTRVESTRLPRIERAQNMLFSAQANSKALERVTPFISQETPKGRLYNQTDVALASFKAGVCVSANLSIGQFDSHGNNDADQMKLIPEFLSGIDYALRRAEELHIREKVVVVIQSEMGRTPTYNDNNGKDHWSIGSIMFLGPGIHGNRAIGATDEKQFIIPVNPKSSQVDRKHGIRIRPETIHLALRQLAGIDQHAFADRFPLKVSAAERLSNLWQGS